jgi:putative DNA primase/helicase
VNTSNDPSHDSRSDQAHGTERIVQAYIEVPSVSLLDARVRDLRGSIAGEPAGDEPWRLLAYEDHPEWMPIETGVKSPWIPEPPLMPGDHGYVPPENGAEAPIPISQARGKKKRAPIDRSTVTRVLPSPKDPMAVARVFVQDHLQRGTLTIRHWRGGWWIWRESHWAEREADAISKSLYTFTEKAVFAEGGIQAVGGPLANLVTSDPMVADGLEPWQPTRHKIGDLRDALAAVVHMDETIDQPSWLGIAGPPVVAMANGLLRLEGRELLPHTPSYWNQTAVPFDFDPDAPEATTWLGFLADLWPDDPDSIAALQEFMGYVISGRLNLHKILLIVGPTRGGKGTIARILGRLVGLANVAGPTLSSLNHDFGMAPLIGKPLAVISDARLGAHRDSSIVVERLLAISGEDTITVNRKYREQWTGKLPTRFLIISNELPQLGDQSGVIANRFVVLLLRNSWLGKEDTTLEDRLSAELTGILNWSLDGLERLAKQGQFTRPASTDEAIIALQDLASPVSAFVRDQCLVGPTHEVVVEVLFKAWQSWAESNGHGKGGSAQTFGRNLRSVVPSLRTARPGERDDRIRIYRGIGLRAQPTLAGTADPRGPGAENEPESDRGPRGSADILIVEGAPGELFKEPA